MGSAICIWRVKVDAVVGPDSPRRVEGSEPDEEGTVIAGHDVVPVLARGGGAGKAHERVEAEEDQLKEIIGEVVDARRPCHKPVPPPLPVPGDLRLPSDHFF